MSLNQASLKADIKIIFSNAFQLNSDSQAAFDYVAEKLSVLIVNTIKSSTITIPAGSVNVAGNSTNQTNPSPITLNNAIL